MANVARNVWSHSVIMCGHFPEGVETFEVDELDEDETRGRWYLRQMLGSADISGPWLLHVLCGNLSHQIEHHVFPDLPSNRYREVAGPVRELFERHGLTYHSRPLLAAGRERLAQGAPPLRAAAAASRRGAGLTHDGVGAGLRRRAGRFSVGVEEELMLVDAAGELLGRRGWCAGARRCGCRCRGTASSRGRSTSTRSS